jgi:hypothetical protein
MAYVNGTATGFRNLAFVGSNPTRGTIFRHSIIGYYTTLVRLKFQFDSG